MKESPLVSVILLNYNYGRFLEQAIRSIRAQTYSCWELIAVDDGSQDDSLEVLERIGKQLGSRCRILRHAGGKNRGIAVSYQLGCSQASGSLIAFLEADDVWEPFNLAHKVAAFRNFPEAGTVFSSYRVLGQGGAAWYWRLYAWAQRCQLPALKPFDAFPYFLSRNPAASFSHFMTRRQFFQRIPLPAQRMKNYDWWVLGHLSLAAPFYFLPLRLSLWRIHAGSAAYGRVNRQALGRLWIFLAKYYQALDQGIPKFEGALSEGRKQRLERAQAYLRALRQRLGKTLALSFVRQPFKVARFGAFMLLRNLLFAPRRIAL